MLGRQQIAALIPHQGAMCLLESVVAWDPDAIRCRSRSHLDPANPLRRDGRLGALCGIEYGLQAAALHGALRAGSAQPPGYLAALSGILATPERLDDPRIGELDVTASLELSQPAGLIYGFRLAAADGRSLVTGRATIALPGRPA